jgi:hypothetical protein
LIFQAALSMVGVEHLVPPGRAINARHGQWKRAMNIFDLTGRTAVITGGNGGIGLGIAQALTAADCNVSIWGRNAEKNKAPPQRRFHGGWIATKSEARLRLQNHSTWRRRCCTIILPTDWPLSVRILAQFLCRWN